MKSWTDLTDEQRARVFDTLIDGSGDCADETHAHEAARAVLLAAREEHITSEAIADACEECGIHEPETVEDAPGFIRRLRRERDAARADVAAALAREARLRAALEAIAADSPDGAPAPGDWLDELGEWERGDVHRELISAVMVAREALHLPADRTALDALLAEARREGAGACVEAARDTAVAVSESLIEPVNGVVVNARVAADAVVAAVERAAAKIEAAT